MYRDAPTSLAASVASYGVWIAELAANIRAAVEGKSSVRYLHNVAHDGSVSRVLSILQIDGMVWPGMGSEVVFELWRKKKQGHRPRGAGEGGQAATPAGHGSGGKPGHGNGGNDGESEYFVRVLFGGKVLKSSSPTLGTMDMIPVQTLLDYFDGLVGENASLVKGLCA